MTDSHKFCAMAGGAAEPLAVSVTKDIFAHAVARFSPTPSSEGPVADTSMTSHEQLVGVTLRNCLTIHLPELLKHPKSSTWTLPEIAKKLSEKLTDTGRQNVQYALAVVAESLQPRIEPNITSPKPDTACRPELSDLLANMKLFSLNPAVAGFSTT